MPQIGQSAHRPRRSRDGPDPLDGHVGVVYDEWKPMTVARPGARHRSGRGCSAARHSVTTERRPRGRRHGSRHRRLHPIPVTQRARLEAAHQGHQGRLAKLGTWTLHFQQLPEGDPVAKLLAQQLSNAEMAPDLWVPQVVFGDDPNINDFLSRNMRRQIKKAWNRLETDGRTVETERRPFRVRDHGGAAPARGDPRRT